MSASVTCARRSANSPLVGGASPILLTLFALLLSNPLAAQNAKPTDLEFHKFLPRVAPDRAVAGVPATSPRGIGAVAAQQMQALQQEKTSRTPAQQKIDSNILYTVRMLASQPAAPGVPYLNTGVDLDANNNIVVDIVANVTDSLLVQIAASGGQVLYNNRGLRSIRATIPPQQIEKIAASPDVIFVSPKQNSMTCAKEGIGFVNPLRFWDVAAGLKQRAAQVRKKMASVMNEQGVPIYGQGSVETEGDFTHRTVDARGTALTALASRSACCRMV